MDHLSHLSKPYLSSPEVKVVKLSKRSKVYLESLYNIIVANNELIFNERLYPEFHVVEDETPFYFSLPGAQFFFSSGLIKRYIKNEEILVSCLTHEIFKSHRGIYEKRSIIPVGYIGTARMLSLTRVSTDVKVELNRLSFLAMRRARRDASAYLNWLQTQNKNTLDFSMQLGDSRNISEEEFLFKNFLVLEDQQGIGQRDEYNSSAGFYVLQRELERVRI